MVADFHQIHGNGTVGVRPHCPAVIASTVELYVRDQNASKSAVVVWKGRRGTDTQYYDSVSIIFAERRCEPVGNHAVTVVVVLAGTRSRSLFDVFDGTEHSFLLDFRVC